MGSSTHYYPFLLFLILILTLTGVVSSHNITAILDAYPDYSTFNSYLTKTKLDDEINTHDTITVLALNNAAMSSATSDHPLSVVKNLLRLLVLLDYYDPSKLHDISNGSVLTTTLYQTTGNPPGNLGFVNITDLQGGKVAFGSAAPGSKLDSSYVKSVKQLPYNISVLEVSSAIIAPGVLTAPAPSPSDVNLTAVLVKSGCKTFANLLLTSGVLKTYESAASKGLTVFAPNDESFKAKGVPDLSKLTSAELVSLLEYHASPNYTPFSSLKTSSGELTTLASNGAGKYVLTASTSGDSVTLHTGVDSSRVADTALDATPLVVMTVDNLLLPEELFGKSPSPAPAPVPVSSPSPTPTPEKSSSPSPVEAPHASPPAPPAETPGKGPSAESPSGSENSTAKNGGVHVSAPLVTELVASATVIFSVLLS